MLVCLMQTSQSQWQICNVKGKVHSNFEYTSLSIRMLYMHIPWNVACISPGVATQSIHEKSARENQKGMDILIYA